MGGRRGEDGRDGWAGRSKELIDACQKQVDELTEQREAALSLVKSASRDREALVVCIPSQYFYHPSLYPSMFTH